MHTQGYSPDGCCWEGALYSWIELVHAHTHQLLYAPRRLLQQLYARPHHHPRRNQRMSPHSQLAVHTEPIPDTLPSIGPNLFHCRDRIDRVTV